MPRQLRGRPARGVSVNDARTLLMRLDGVSPGRSYGLPSFLLGGRFFARFRDQDTVVVLQLSSIEDRDVLLRLDPRAFFFTDHYQDYPAVLIRLAEVRPKQLADVVTEAWRDLGSRRAALVPRTTMRTPAAGRRGAKHGKRPA